jgi:acyl-ACP thioesterase
VDSNNRCKLSKIVDMLQNAATLHSKSIGYGTKEMMELKQAWLMLGWHVRILKYPEADMDVEVRTWSRGLKGVEAKRGYEVVNEKDEVLLIADSTWTLFDLESQKLIRAPEEMINAYSALERNPFEGEKSERVRDNQLYEQEVKIKVGKNQEIKTLKEAIQNVISIITKIQISTIKLQTL